MAGAGQSKAAHRRALQARHDATQERVTLIAIGVLVAVAILVGAGVVWSVILPPRAHVITVGNASYNAGDVAQRAEFLLRTNAPSEGDPIQDVLKMIRRHETLLQAGAADAGEITADDMEKAIWTRVGLPPESSKAEYAKAYETYLRTNNIDKATLERMVRAQLIYERLSKKEQPSVGDSGPQLHLQNVVSRDQNKLKQFRDAVAGGADFSKKALEMGLADRPEAVDLGWVLPPVSGYLKDTAQVDKLQAGQMTEVLARDGGVQFEVYRVAERDEKRAYTDGNKITLGNRKVDEWITAQADKVKIAEDLSDGERQWVLDRVTRAARKIAEQRAKEAPAGGQPFRVTP